MAFNPIRGAISSSAPQGGAGFNPYAAGKKRYGGGRLAPNVGKTPNMAGYGQRDAAAAARRDALIRRAGGQ